MNTRCLTGGLLTAALILVGLVARNDSGIEPSTASESNDAAADEAEEAECVLVEDGFGPPGTVQVQAEEIVTGLEVPWGLAFLSDGDMMISERSGQLRLVEDGQLRGAPVATVSTTGGGEGLTIEVRARAHCRPRGGRPHPRCHRR